MPLRVPECEKATDVAGRAVHSLRTATGGRFEFRLASFSKVSDQFQAYVSWFLDVSSLGRAAGRTRGSRT